MNYYPFHIGDYASKTRHLSWDEDAAYRRLLDAYYTLEKPLPADMRAVFRLVMATTDAQREAVTTVLHEFFEQSPEGWRNSRADAELIEMRERQQKQRDKANKRWHQPKPGAGNAETPAPAMPNSAPGNAAPQNPAMPQHPKVDAVASKGDAVAMPPTPTPTPTPTPKAAPTETVDAPSARAQVEAQALLDRLKDEPQESQMTRPVEIAVLLRSKNCITTQMHPQVVEWAQAGVPDLVLAEAVAVAKTRKGQTRFGVEYLAPIVADILAGPKKRTDATWAMSDDGIARKARELGIPEHRWPATFAGLRQMCHDVARSAA